MSTVDDVGADAARAELNRRYETYHSRYGALNRFSLVRTGRQDPDTGRWHYTEPDWKELYAVVTGHGPRSAERLAFRRLHYAETHWVRDTIMAAPVAA